MWAPQSFNAAFALALLSMLCWGSWSNTAKAASAIPFPIFYFDFSLGAFLSGLAAFISPLNDAQVAKVGAEPTELHVAAALGAGALFNVANVLLVTGIQVAGLSVAFPVGIGTALVLGTLLTYVTDPRGQPALLFLGVALAFVAILCQVAAHAAHKAHKATVAAHATRSEAESSESVEFEMMEDDGGVDRALKPAADSSWTQTDEASACGCFKRAPPGLLMCCCAGGLMSLWAPLSALSMRALSAEASFAICASGGVESVRSSASRYSRCERPTARLSPRSFNRACPNPTHGGSHLCGARELCRALPAALRPAAGGTARLVRAIW
jgi:hypothetical protein